MTIELTTNQANTLLLLIEEEKLTGDLYEALYAATGLEVFDGIATQEDGHMDKLLEAAAHFEVDVSSIPDEAGVFANAELQELYDTLLIYGSQSAKQALEVAMLAEITDIASLESASNAITEPRLGIMYGNLIEASGIHYSVFLEDYWMA